MTTTTTPMSGPAPAVPASTTSGHHGAAGGRRVRGSRPARSPRARAARGPAALPLELGRPPGPPPSPAALGLLRQAEVGLLDAERLADPARRYAAAHLAALRAGAAVLAVRAQPAGRRRAGRSVWQLLAAVAPELGEWAAFFAAGSAVRAAADAGISRAVNDRAADDLVRQAAQFLQITRRLVSSR